MQTKYRNHREPQTTTCGSYIRSAQAKIRGRETTVSFFQGNLYKIVHLCHLSHLLCIPWPIISSTFCHHPFPVQSSEGVITVISSSSSTARTTRHFEHYYYIILSYTFSLFIFVPTPFKLRSCGYNIIFIWCDDRETFLHPCSVFSVCMLVASSKLFILWSRFFSCWQSSKTILLCFNLVFADMIKEQLKFVWMLPILQPGSSLTQLLLYNAEERFFSSTPLSLFPWWWW